MHVIVFAQVSLTVYCIYTVYIELLNFRFRFIKIHIKKNFLSDGQSRITEYLKLVRVF